MNKLMLAAIALLITGCADNNPQPTKPVPDPVTCSASLHQASISYQLVNGQLQMTAVGQPTLLLKRDPTNGVATSALGVWDLGDPSTNGLITVTGQLDIEKTKISSIATCQYSGRSSSAIAVSPAFVDDRTITIKEDSTDSVVF